MRYRVTGEIGPRGGSVRRTRANSDAANLPRGPAQRTIELEERVVALVREGKSRAEARADVGLSSGHFNRLFEMLRCEGRI
jgi:hypothetical protein